MNVGDKDGVNVKVGVKLAVGVADCVGVNVSVIVGRGVRVGSTVALGTGVRVKVGVAVREGVAVEVEDGVKVGVRDIVAVTAYCPFCQRSPRGRCGGRVYSLRWRGRPAWCSRHCRRRERRSRSSQGLSQA